MNIKEIIQKIVNFGIPISIIAKRVHKDNSTISKWLKGHSNISNELATQLENLVKQMNNEWQNIFINHRSD